MLRITASTQKFNASSFDSLRHKAEARVAKLQKSRQVMEDARKRQLWSIVQTLDTIAREEVQTTKKGTDDDATITVDFVDTE
jgi:hypothetical protein